MSLPVSGRNRTSVDPHFGQRFTPSRRRSFSVSARLSAGGCISGGVAGTGAAAGSPCGMGTGGGSPCEGAGTSFMAVSIRVQRPSAFAFAAS